MVELLVSSLLATPAAKGHGTKLKAREKRNDDGSGGNQKIFHNNTLCDSALSLIGSETTQWRRMRFKRADGLNRKVRAKSCRHAGGRMPAATSNLMAMTAVGVKSIGRQRRSPD
jgi:hypothetical protein